MRATDVEKMFLEFMARKKEAEIARKSAAKQLYEKEISKTSLIEVEMSIEILELELNQAVNIELGSYIE